MTFRAARRRVEDILASTLALPSDFLYFPVVFVLRHGRHIHLFPHEPVVLGCRDGVGPGQTLEIAKMQLAKTIKADGLRLTTLLATQKVEVKSSPVVYREGFAAFQAFCSNSMSHGLLSYLVERLGLEEPSGYACGLK